MLQNDLWHYERGGSNRRGLTACFYNAATLTLPWQITTLPLQYATLQRHLFCTPCFVCYFRFVLPGYHIRKYLLLCILLTACAAATAQPVTFNFHHLTTSDGLSNPVVRCITSDKYGYTWLGTVNGLNRFNGYDIKILQHHNDDSLSLPDNNIQYLFCDSEGTLWVALSTGLYKYDYSNSHFLIERGTENLSIGAMLQGGPNEIYVLTDAGLMRFDTKVNSFTPLVDITNSNGKTLMSKTVNDFFVHGNGNIYIATDTGLVIYNIKTRDAERADIKPLKKRGIERLVADSKGSLWINYNDNGSMLLRTDLAFSQYDVYPQFLSPQNKFKDNLIIGVYADNKDRIWVTTNRQGLCLYNEPENNFIQFEPDPIQSTSIASEFITFLYQDKEGYIWTGTEGYGSDYFHPDKNLFHAIQESYIQKPSLPNSWSRAAAEDNNHNLWLGTAGGLVKYDLHTNKMTVFQNTLDKPNILHANSIRSLLCDDDLVWIGTGKGLNRYHQSTGKMDFMGEKDSLPLSFYWSILKDHEGNIWFGCREGLYRYNHRSKKMENLLHDSLLAPYCRTNVRTLFEDSHNRLWIGYFSQGMLMYDPAHHLVRHFPKNKAGTTDVKDGNILSIMEDKTGLIWFSTLSDFCSYDVNTQTFKHYLNSDKGISEITSSFMCDDSNRLWIASSRGLYMLDSTRKFFKSFDIDDGLASVNFNNQSAFRMSNGTYIYGTLKGFVLFNPKDYNQRNDSIKAYLSSFKIFGKEYKPPSGIEEMTAVNLGYSQNFFTLEMTALNYSNAHQNWYACKLEPFDKDWIYSKDRRANYTNVPGGDYTFYFKTSIDRERWDVAAKKIMIHVDTIYYKTWWFRLLMTVMVIAALSWIYHLRLSQKDKMLMLEKKAYSLEKEKALVMYESLKQQLNPHFLFNSLTSLSSLITSNPVNAKQFLDRLSKIYRYILQSRDNETVPLADEIKLAETYTQLQQTRFREGLQLKIEIAEEYLHRKIAPVTLQNLIENAIKHNIIDVLTPLVVHIFVEDDWLVVRNNYQKKTFVDTSNRQGIANMQSLYHYLSGKQMIITEDEHYYTIKIPLL
jgi:ligand-binding sensor domain-containing protein